MSVSSSLVEEIPLGSRVTVEFYLVHTAASCVAHMRALWG